MKRALAALTWMVVAVGLGAASGNDDPPETAPPTYRDDIAPLIHRHCSGCHRPGEAGPFPLLTFTDVRKRAEQIRDVTRSRYMPPWLPARGDLRYVGERGLTDSEIEQIARWVESGTPHGEGASPEAPQAGHRGWQLGEPDLIVELPEPFLVPADGQDVIRNFVLPVPVSERRWVAAVELQPGDKRTVHHAILKCDRTRYTRRLDARDPEPGFGGMEMGNAEYPDGQIVVWTPGMVAVLPHPGIAWEIDGQTDLVLQLHMVPVGRPAEVRPRVGLHFTDEPPTLDPFVLLLRNDRIDIPAGEAAYVVEDTFELPVSVTALEIYPHAHYLGKRMEISAEVPGADRLSLLTIPDWDFNWQGSYRFRDPPTLPRGTRLRMRYLYDNSEDNIRNPSYPPRRVTVGNRSSDEMATLALQVLTETSADRMTLRIAQWEDLLRDHPDNPVGYYNLGVAYAEQGDMERSAAHYAVAVKTDPDDVGAHFYLAGAYYKMERWSDAERHYREAVRIDPEFAEARMLLGWVLARQNRLEEAREQLERAVAVEPDFARAHYALGRVLERAGDPRGAVDAYRRALELDPEMASARRRLEALEPASPASTPGS